MSRFRLFFTLGMVTLVAVAGCDRQGVRAGKKAGNGAPSVTTPLDRNLLTNGDAEALSQSSKDVPDGWSRTPDVVAMNYGGIPEEWQTSRPGCPDGRERYFRLALSINEPSKFITQRITLSQLDADVDSGNLECAVGGWFGGWVGDDASALLDVDFVNADGSVIGKLATEPPDPKRLIKPEVGKATLIKEVATAPLPPGTRRLDVRLMAVRPSQNLDTNGVAMADSLSLVLRKKPKLESAAR